MKNEVVSEYESDLTISIMASEIGKAFAWLSNLYLSKIGFKKKQVENHYGNHERKIRATSYIKTDHANIKHFTRYRGIAFDAFCSCCSINFSFNPYLNS